MSRKNNVRIGGDGRLASFLPASLQISADRRMQEKKGTQSTHGLAMLVQDGWVFHHELWSTSTFEYTPNAR